MVSAEGLVTEIPEGWVQSEQFAFEWQPIAGNPIAEVFDKWTVARACGPGGCDERSLDEWLEIGESLPTFVQAVAADSGLTINRDEFGDDHRVVEGTTAAETTIVYVAAFDDGWNFYVECGLSLGVRGDDRLIDEIVEVVEPRCQSGSDQPERCVASSNVRLRAAHPWPPGSRADGRGCSAGPASPPSLVDRDRGGVGDIEAADLAELWDEGDAVACGERRRSATPIFVADHERDIGFHRDLMEEGHRSSARSQ